MEDDCEIRWWILRPVEDETRHGLEGLACQSDRDGLAGICKVGLPFRRGGTIDCGNGKLTGLIVVWGGDGKTLSDVSGNSCDIGNVPVLEGDGAVGWELVGG